MYLFLDDERVPSGVTWDPEFPLGKQWFIVRDIDQFKKVIDWNLENIEHIAFDHDLGPNHYPRSVTDMGDHSDGRTGMDCAKYLVDQCIERNIKIPNFSVHSMNPAGRENIRSLLNGFRRHQLKHS